MIDMVCDQVCLNNMLSTLNMKYVNEKQSQVDLKSSIIKYYYKVLLNDYKTFLFHFIINITIPILVYNGVNAYIIISRRHNMSQVMQGQNWKAWPTCGCFTFPPLCFHLHKVEAEFWNLVFSTSFVSVPSPYIDGYCRTSVHFDIDINTNRLFFIVLNKQNN